MKYFGSKKLKKLFYSYLVNFELENGAMGWGRKPSFFRAQNISSKFDIPLYCLEDGFIRSLGLGKDGFLPLSLVVDTRGIYFDAFQVSDLEQLIYQSESQVFSKRAQSNINKITTYKITKYNQKFLQIDENLFPSGKNILVVDQT